MLQISISIAYYMIFSRMANKLKFNIELLSEPQWQEDYFGVVHN